MMGAFTTRWTRFLVLVLVTACASNTGLTSAPPTWMGLTVQPEGPRAGYDRDAFGSAYSALEDEIIASQPKRGRQIFTPYTCTEVDPVSWTHPNCGNGGVHGCRRRKGRIRYAPEFRRQMVELVRAGRTPEELAREFEPTANTIRKWVEQLDQDEGLRADGLTSEERTELRQLRRKVKQLDLEREILGKAAAWFARESITLPRPSDS